MKLTAILLTIGCIAASASGGYGQRVTLDLKDAPLQTVFKELSRQSGVSIIYNEAMLAGTRPVTIKIKDASVEDALRICFADQPLQWSMENNSIIVKRKPIVPNVVTTTEPNPPIDVKGRIVNEKGEPVLATVTVKGTKQATSTDENGFFVLKNVDENAMLVITATNIDTREIELKGRTDLDDVIVKVKVSSMEEVIIKKGYYDEKQKFSVSNVTHIDSKVIEQQPVQNLALALQGRVPGLEVTQLTGMPGGGVRIRIQGRNSIQSGLDPLIVIDGVPFPSQLTNSILREAIVQGGNPLNYINPADIESIDVLKDADATAIYGSRAANGAVLITTKKGKVGRTKLNINLQQGWGRVAHKMKMLNTRQYLDMRYEGFRNTGVIWTDPTVVADDLKVWDTTRYTDWQKELIGGTAEYTQMNASISGGTANMQYLLGANYNRQTTVFPGDFDDKVGGMHFNINSSTSDQRLKVQLTGTYIYDQNHLPREDLTNEAILMEPNAPSLYNADGSLNWAPNASGSSTWTNPLGIIQNQQFNNTTKNLVTNVSLSYNILKGLNILGNAGYTNTQSEMYLPTKLEFFKPEQRINAQRTAVFDNRNMSSWIAEPQLQYSGRLVGGKINGLVGSTIQKSSFSYHSVAGVGYPTDLLMKTLAAAKTIGISYSSSGITRFNSLFGRLNYNWDDKYLLNLTARRDGSNKFGGKNKFHNFWSAGLGWIFSEEKLIQQQLPFLSFGKLRTSYGTTGNDQIPDFSYLSFYIISNPTILYQNNIGLNAALIPNPHLQWEETRKWQLGIDLGFFHDCINLSITYARNRSSNQLAGYQIPTLTGFSTYTKNLPATIQNTSWEFSISSLNIKRNEFTWNSNFNFTIPRNKLISFPGIELTSYALGNNGVIVGQPLGVAKTYAFAGLNPINGRYTIFDRNGDPSVSTSGISKSVLISPQASYYCGLVNSIQYKNFQVDFLLQFVRKLGTKDMYYYNGSAYPGEFLVGLSNQPTTVLDRWQKPGDIASIGRYSSFSLLTGILDSDGYYSDDASFIRLKNLSISWQLPERWLGNRQSTSGTNAKLFFRGQNLFTITNYTGLDPETMSISTLPPLQMWTVGVQMTL